MHKIRWFAEKHKILMGTMTAKSWKLIGNIQKSQKAAQVPSFSASEISAASNQRPATAGDAPGKPLREAVPAQKRAPESRPAILSNQVLLAAIVTASAVLVISNPQPLQLVLSLGVLFAAGSLFVNAHRSEVDRHRQKLSENETVGDLEQLQDQNWELKEREHRHRTLVEAFGDMIMDRDSTGRVTYVNPAFARFFDASEAELLHQPLSVEFRRTNDDPDLVDRDIPREVCIDIKGERKWLAWLDLPIRSEQTNENTIRTVARDITRQKNIELELRNARTKAETASEAKTRFLANVSHEMRTPLNGILGMSGLLADTPLTAEQVTYVNAVHDSGTALLTLIEDILDMTLVEAGHLEFRTTSLSPHRLIEDVCELLASRAHSKNISIASHVDWDVPLQIEADAGRLRQVLINLIGNAIKFTDHGGVFVACEAEADDRSTSDSVKLSFEISDTGPGIAEKDQQLIFEEFSQADSKSTRKHGGAGLGLTISRRIVQEMGGEISIESQPGEGSTFRFQIEVGRAEDPQSERRKASNENPSPVVLITDDPMTARGIKMNLDEAKIPFRSHTSAGFAKTGKEQLDLTVLIDNAVQFSLAETPFDKNARKIALLNPDQRPGLNDLLKSGYDGYLIKPVRKASLLNILSPGSGIKDDSRNVSKIDKWRQGTELTGKSRTILLAEDNDINALLARSVLEKAGHQVTRAVNGAEAVSIYRERLEDQPFDLLLLDLQMPVMDGMEALKEIRALEAVRNLAPRPIHILTADEQESTRDVVLKNGANGFLTKPLEPKKLLHSIQKM